MAWYNEFRHKLKVSPGSTTFGFIVGIITTISILLALGQNTDYSLRTYKDSIALLEDRVEYLEEDVSIRDSQLKALNSELSEAKLKP